MKTDAVMDAAAIKPAFAKLAQLLQSNDFETIDYFAAIQNDLRAVLPRGDFEKLKKLIADYESDEALKVLKTAVSELGIAL